MGLDTNKENYHFNPIFVFSFIVQKWTTAYKQVQTIVKKIITNLVSKRNSIVSRFNIVTINIPK